MRTIVELTAGDVAGIIALAMFIVRTLCPTLLVYILSGIVNDNETAATWNVVSRLLQSSHWPAALRTDAAKTHGVRRNVLLSRYAMVIASGLCAIAGVITPVGLYNELEPSDHEIAPFAYVQDTSPFGRATSPRSSLPFSRVCSQLHGPFLQGPAPCPYSGNTVILDFDGSSYTFEYPYGYNTTVPQIVRDIYSSGTQNEKTTVSNYFDIQWRQYNLGHQSYLDNGSFYLVADYRSVTSLILDNNAITPVEGLVVDMQTPGIGFRNHTLPTGLQNGATWTEDLLFVEPQSSCVNLNLTLDYTIGPNSSVPLSELYLVDRGGFFALNHTYPVYDHANAQNDPELQARAYQAAYLNNVWSMAYLNVTNPNGLPAGEQGFSYLNSSYGKKFPLPTNSLQSYNELSISSTFGSYLPLGTSGGDYQNPFNVTADDFNGLYLLCSGTGATDIANISNIYVACGLMRSTPVRVDGGSPYTFEVGSKWSSSLYSCTSTMRATVRTVSFALNGTSSLEDLHITGTTYKEYSDNSSTPLWGVEDSGLTNDGISPVWGLVNPAYEGYPNISLVRKPSLYLSGYSSDPVVTLDGIVGGYYEYLPGSDFPPIVMNTVFTMDNGLLSSAQPITFDYTGYQNMAMYLQWQNLSATAETAGSIIDLIWTDIAAGAVVGSKGVLGPGNAGLADETVTMTVSPIVNKIKYHYAFGTAAYILVVVLILLILFALVAALTRKASPNKIRNLVNQLSPGRIFTTILYPEMSSLAMGSKEWSQQYSRVEINMNDMDRVVVSRHIAAVNRDITPPRDQGEKYSVHVSPDQHVR